MEAVRNRLREFDHFVQEKIGTLPADVHRDGSYTVFVQGDSLTVLCEDIIQATEIGVHLFEQAYFETWSYSQPFWLRGAVSTWSKQHAPYKLDRIEAKQSEVGEVQIYEDDFLRAMAMVQSGFGGMRLVIRHDLVSVAVKQVFVRSYGESGASLELIKTLRDVRYPDREEYCDVLWMANNPDYYDKFKGVMAKRFKTAVRNPSELIQAAMTRAVFDMVDTLLWVAKTAAAAPTAAKSNTPKKDASVKDALSKISESFKTQLPNGPIVLDVGENVDSITHEGMLKIENALVAAWEKCKKPDSEWVFLGRLVKVLKDDHKGFDFLEFFKKDKFVVMLRYYFSDVFEFNEVRDPKGPIHIYVRRARTGHDVSMVVV